VNAKFKAPKLSIRPGDALVWPHRALSLTGMPRGQPLAHAEVEALARKLGAWLGSLRKVEVEMAAVRPSDVAVPAEIGLARVTFQGAPRFPGAGRPLAWHAGLPMSLWLTSQQGGRGAPPGGLWARRLRGRLVQSAAGAGAPAAGRWCSRTCGAQQGPRVSDYLWTCAPSMCLLACMHALPPPLVG